MSDEKLFLPDGYVFVRKFLLGKPTVLLMNEGATGSTDGVRAVGPGDTYEEAEQECLRRYYRQEALREDN